MVNENYEPNDREATVIDLFKQGRDSGDPWGRVNPLFIRQNTSLDKGQVEYALRNLKNAGWIEQVNQGGLYEFVDDPRENRL
ncbi:MarR family transcriptional regulator [Haloarcula onubensis]|uniref:MarR family transcriptional regulator n=1 Tax=Haloarcula onubensis TaxID=2950539 RepID=A0ABU2FNC7_9EURY|nr:MarR family transcriptional regulator [Halomicroarcula sp. S3CR25-11]MDS0282265.1 MarR family transcriptional regulator [Halomicroarcula sp. S3CR25-11]